MLNNNDDFTPTKLANKQILYYVKSIYQHAMRPEILKMSDYINEIRAKKDTATESEKETAKKVELEYTREMVGHHTFFSKNNPAIFWTIIDGPRKFDINRLITMLELREKIDKKELDFETTNKEIGEKYANEFVKPIVDKLPPKKE